MLTSTRGDGRNVIESESFPNYDAMLLVSVTARVQPVTSQALPSEVRE
jgi:hypothetical protein